MKGTLPLRALLVLLGSAAGAFPQSSFVTSPPEEVLFGSVLVGQSASMTVLAGQSFADDLVVAANSTNPVFTITPSSQVMPVESVVMFTVVFRPTGDGVETGTLRFTADDGNGMTFVVHELQLSGSGVRPFSLSRSSISFEPVLVGSSSSQTFDIQVSSLAETLDLSVQSSNSAVFAVSPIRFSSLQSGNPGTVTVTFNPDEAGNFRGAITVSGGGVASSVAVDGDGSGFLLSNTALDFAGVPVGCAASRSFTVITEAPFNFQVVPTTAGLPFAAVPPEFTAEAPTPVNVEFAPVAPGAVQGLLRIFARSGGRIIQQRDLEVSGAGVGLVADPGSIDFGTVPAGTSSTLSASLGATPPAPLEGEFTAQSDNPAFQATPTGGGVEVVFTPSSEGPQSGLITVQFVSASDPECVVPLEIPVQGVGGEALLTLNPSSLNFGGIAVGESSAAQGVVVRNQSTEGYTAAVSSDHPAFVVGEPGAVSQSVLIVPAGGTASVDVTFQPSSPGAASGAIRFELRSSSAGSGGPPTLVRTVPVSGEGIAPSISYNVVRSGASTPVTPGGAVDFGPIAVASAGAVEVEVRNDGSVPAQVDEISVSGGAFSAAGLPALPATIGAGDALSFMLQFAPNEPGAYSGSLAVGAAEFTLSGSGVLGGAEITGLSDTIPGNGQPTVGVVLSDPAPQDLTGILVMTYTPVGGLQPDPSVQFETGGTSVSFSVPEGASDAVFPNGQALIGFQSGTVAAGFVFTASLSAGESDVTPSPAPTRSASILAGAPSITAVSVESVTANGFTVVVVGFSPSREITQATFSFTGRNGVQVEPASVTPSGIAGAFQAWYASPDSQAYGSMFTLTMPFTISGEANGIAAVSATVSNSQGTSQAVSANLP